MHPLAIAGSIGSNGGFIGGRIIRLLTATALVDRRSGLRFRHRSDAVMNVLIAIASFGDQRFPSVNVCVAPERI